MQKHCLECGKLFSKHYSCSLKSWGKTKFCSRKCASDFRIGKSLKHSGQFKKGFKPWNKGLTKYIDERVAKISGENHYDYKGEKVSYIGLHNWVRKELGTPKKCEHCGTTKARMYNWANRSGEYKRDLSDWLRLCRSCHHKFDNLSVKMWEARRTGQVKK